MKAAEFGQVKGQIIDVEVNRIFVRSKRCHTPFTRHSNEPKNRMSNEVF